VSTPNTGLTVRIVANFTDEQLAEAGGVYDSTSDLAAELIGRLLFIGGNVTSVDTAPTGAPLVTVIEVVDERRLEENVEAAEALFGEAEVRVAESVIAGIDVEVILGMSYLEREAERVGEVRPEVAPTESTDVAGTVAEDG
jgi:hypothetical protein